MARMLGHSPRQPFCGKCCGEHTKAGNALADRLVDGQMFGAQAQVELGRLIINVIEKEELL